MAINCNLLPFNVHAQSYCVSFHFVSMNYIRFLCHSLRVASCLTQVTNYLCLLGGLQAAWIFGLDILVIAIGKYIMRSHLLAGSYDLRLKTFCLAFGHDRTNLVGEI